MDPKPPNEAKDELPEPIVALERCLIRPYHPSDAAPSAAEANNPKVITYMSNSFPSPYTLQDAVNWIELCARDDPTMNYAICDSNTGAFMGGVGLKPRKDIEERTVEIGYWLGEQYWGKGLMGQVVRGFTDWVFTTRPFVARIEAKVIEGNEASRKVLVREDYVFEGTHRKAVWKREQLLDTYMYAVVRTDWEQTQGLKKD